MTHKLKSGFPPEAFDELSMLEDSSWWFRSRNQIIIWVIKKYAINLKDYLEIGCGTGYVLKGIDEAFAVRSLNGDEYYEEGLEYAKIRVPNASFRRMDATKMKDQDRYDAIGAFDVIEHIDDDQLALLNCFQALKKQGHLFLTVPQHMWLWSALDEQACHVRRYSQIELKQKVEKAGFQVIASTSFISFLVPFMWLSRQRLNKKPASSQGELQPPAWLNLCFWSVMQLEIIFLKLGVRLPVGGSLILVAQKP